MQPDEAKALWAYLRRRPSPPSLVLFPSNRGDPIARRTLDWLIKRYGEAADLPPAKRHFHCLKHSIATHLLEIIVRGDSHYGRPEAMAWCERNRIGYIFGLAGNPVLLRQVAPLAEDAALGRLAGEGEKVRRYGDFRYAAKSWTVERRVIARVEAGPQGADSRFIVDRRPAGPDAADDMAQHQRHLGPVRRLAGAQDDGNGFAGGCLINVDR